MRIAVIGAGPAGFYASAALLRRFAEARIDLIERLPVPFGLVRYGVAPDHASTRNVISQFSSLMEDNARLSYFGNVHVSDHGPKQQPHHTPTIPPDYLSALYDAVVFATGAARPRSLHIPHDRAGSVPHVHSAHDFVLWLNGHPDLHRGGERASVGAAIGGTLERAERVSVVGAGNVAIDVSRLLLRPRRDVVKLEASPSALRILSEAPPLHNVHLFARRPAPFARWTTAALREVCTKVPGVIVRTDVAAVRESTENLGFKPSRAQARMLDVLTNHALQLESALETCPSSPDPAHSLTLTFNTAVNRFSTSAGKLLLHLAKTRPTTDEPAHSIRIGTEEEKHACDAAFLSLGYESGDQSPGRIAVGWANGMARGIIGDNKWDAESVVAAMPVPSLDEKKPGVQEWLRERSLQPVSWNGWLRIRAEETRRGRQLGCEGGSRVETRKEMLEIADEY